jgi:hypothetical protein
MLTNQVIQTENPDLPQESVLFYTVFQPDRRAFSSGRSAPSRAQQYCCLRCTGTSCRAKRVYARRPPFFPQKWPMSVPPNDSKLPDTYWSFKHALNVRVRRAA